MEAGDDDLPTPAFKHITQAAGVMKQKMRKLITTKPHKYGTRHLVAGDEYEVPERHAFALVAGKRARFAPARDKPAAAPVPKLVTVLPDHETQPVAADPLDDLRARAKELGIEVDGRWGAARLRYEINQARKD
jgi:hypothetical protein